MEALLKCCQRWPSDGREPDIWLPGVGPVALSNNPNPELKIAAAHKTSDEKLMQLYRGGDQDAFQTLYERQRGALLRFVRRMALDGSDAEEIVQETWMAVIRGKERYVPDARFVTYLFSIARRRAMDRWRRRGRRPELEDGDALDQVPGPARTQPEAIVAGEALALAMVAALDVLPHLQREALLLRAETDLTIDEIAQVTDTTRETVKSRLRYGLRRLRAALEPWT